MAADGNNDSNDHDFRVSFDDRALLDNNEVDRDLSMRPFYGRPEGEGGRRRPVRTITTAEEERNSNSTRSSSGASKGDRNSKLGTFNGVFVPTTLNVLSILMFLRFGFIIGQAGILGIFGLLFISFSIDLLTTLSISAISTNGTVRGGGAYYMISRSLGPEFGGSIGIVFYIGQILNW